MAQSLPLVQSWNEWDVLEEIVVGTADGAHFDLTEPGHRPRVRGGRDRAFPSGPKPDDVIARANHQLDGLSSLLESRGVVVRRPEPHALDRQIATPHFTARHQYGVACPRDVMLTVGSEIIEAPMSRRARYFESLAYRAIVGDYWRRDPSMTWTVAPKPTMADGMYRADFWELSEADRHARMHEFEFCISQDEIVFDAADVSRLGNDVLVQESMTTNRLGIEWLRRHLGARGIRVWPIHFPLDRYPSHIDCTLVPLRPGLALTNPERPMLDHERQRFERNGWTLVDVPPPSLDNDQMPPYCQSSKWLSMNVLSLSPSIVVCEEHEHALHELLDGLGFEVVTVPFRDVYEFGGSLHCATWDVRRSGPGTDAFVPDGEGP